MGQQRVKSMGSRPEDPSLNSTCTLHLCDHEQEFPCYKHKIVRAITQDCVFTVSDRMYQSLGGSEKRQIASSKTPPQSPSP